jgi:hypothetical protein
MIGQPGLHRRGYAKRLVNPAVVVVHEVKRHHLGVILIASDLSAPIRVIRGSKLFLLRAVRAFTVCQQCPLSRRMSINDYYNLLISVH